jgi:hypothetical protein
MNKKEGVGGKGGSDENTKRNTKHTHKNTVHVEHS